MRSLTCTDMCTDHPLTCANTRARAHSRVVSWATSEKMWASEVPLRGRYLSPLFLHCKLSHFTSPPLSKKSSKMKAFYRKLENWLSSSEHALLSQGTRVWFPAASSSCTSQPPVTPAPGNPTPLAPAGTCAHLRVATYRHTQVHKIKSNKS